MKAYLLVSGVVFVLLAATAFVVIYGHWGESSLSSILVHAALGIGLVALAIWAFRLNGRLGTTAA